MASVCLLLLVPFVAGHNEAPVTLQEALVLIRRLESQLGASRTNPPPLRAAGAPPPGDRLRAQPQRSRMEEQVPGAGARPPSWRRLAEEAERRARRAERKLKALEQEVAARRMQTSRLERRRRLGRFPTRANDTQCIPPDALEVCVPNNCSHAPLKALCSGRFLRLLKLTADM